MEITIKSTALMTMDEFLEYLEMRGSRNTTDATRKYLKTLISF